MEETSGSQPHSTVEVTFGDNMEFQASEDYGYDLWNNLTVNGLVSTQDSDPSDDTGQVS